MTVDAPLLLKQLLRYIFVSRDTEVDPCMTPTELVEGSSDVSVSEDHEQMGANEDAQEDKELSSIMAEPETEKEAGTAESPHEEDSHHDTIQSQIQALTQQLSFPQANILSLMKAAEAAEEEVSKDEVHVGLETQRESLIMKILAERGSMDFSILGATKNVSPRETHTPRTSLRTPGQDTQSRGEGTSRMEHRTSTFRSSLSESPRKELGRLVESTEKKGMMKTPGAQSQTALREKDMQASPAQITGIKEQLKMKLHHDLWCGQCYVDGGWWVVGGGWWWRVWW